ncbi:MAG: hypothetical protein KDA49_07435 [Rhodospirillaceae bacterium]|nr:hypothetical protein [Rhodospirillaceae bacterium]MCA8932287.1 hypothetical protein [Rhodospirillaceae bacterium]
MRMLFALLAALTVFAAPASAEDLSIAGRYTLMGTNPNGSQYSGTAEIVAVGPGQVQIIQTVGGQTWAGQGGWTGDDLQIVYPDFNVMAVYGLNPDGSLEGNWGERGSTVLQGWELMTPQ